MVPPVLHSSWFTLQSANDTSQLTSINLVVLLVLLTYIITVFKIQLNTIK